jgi:methyl-accepting chemotaxis protein
MSLPKTVTHVETRSAQQVTDDISGVAEGANETRVASSQVVSGADTLIAQADALRNDVHRFLAAVQAA